MRIFGLDIRRAGVNKAQMVGTPSTAGNGIQRRVCIEDASRYSGLFEPYRYIDNFVFMFHNISEVQFPIMYICKRIVNAQFVLRKSVDDSIIWADTARGVKDKYVANIVERGLLQAPNKVMSFKEFVINAFVNKLLCGNQYIFANTNENEGRLWETCNEFYVLPTQDMNVHIRNYNLLGRYDKSNVVYHYNSGAGYRELPSDLVYHVKDIPSLSGTNEDMYLGKSRLLSQRYAISNICAVYEARNVIYVKRGALGLIVNQDKDVDGAVVMTQKTKDAIKNEYYESYGIDRGKAPIAVIDRPVSYIKIGMSINELEPFRECFVDAASIAGIYGVDSNLIPRENNPTYSNIANAELNVYNSVVLPEVKVWLDGFNKFLGLYDSGYYIDALWDDVAIMQDSVIKRNNAKATISNRCKSEFLSGVITLNDWRVAIGKERVDSPLYAKTLLEMSEEELNILKSKLS